MSTIDMSICLHQCRRSGVPVLAALRDDDFRSCHGDMRTIIDKIIPFEERRGLIETSEVQQRQAVVNLQL